MCITVKSFTVCITLKSFEVLCVKPLLQRLVKPVFVKPLLQRLANVDDLQEMEGRLTQLLCQEKAVSGSESADNMLCLQGLQAL